MPQSMLEIVLRTLKQGQGGKQAAAELKEVKGTVAELSQGFLGFNAASLTATGAVVAVGAAVASSVTDWQAYAEQIRSLESITGTGSEETSRLVQAFDDLGIEVDKTSSVMATAARKGFVATIDNVAKLADEYNRLGTQEEKNKLLNDRLGKSGFELAKAFDAGGKAIRDAAAAQAEGMLVTAEDAEAAERLRVAQDNLNDSTTELKNNIAKALVPALADLAEKTNLVISGEVKATDLHGSLSRAAAQAAANEKLLALAERDAGRALLEYNSSADVGTQSQNQLTARLADGKQRGWDPAVIAASMYVDAARKAKTANDELDATTWGQVIAQQAEQARDRVEAARQALQTFGESFATQVDQELKAKGLKGETLMQAEKVLDQTYGTELEWQTKVSEGAKALAQSYSSPADLEKFKTALETRKNKLEEESTKLKEARDIIKDQFEILQKMTEKSWDVRIVYITRYTGDTAPNPGNSGTYDPTKGGTEDPLARSGGQSLAAASGLPLIGTVNVNSPTTLQIMMAQLRYALPRV